MVTGIEGRTLQVASAMIVPAVLYQLVEATTASGTRSTCWLPVAFRELGKRPERCLLLRVSPGKGLLAASIMIHGLTSLLVGLLYGAMLPMYPRNPIFTAGITIPLLFTGIIHSALGIVSPILNERIDWFWFVISQVAFGLVCGYVVNRHTRIRTAQFRALPFAVRAGIHSDQGVSLEQARSEDKKDDPK